MSNYHFILFIFNLEIIDQIIKYLYQFKQIDVKVFHQVILYYLPRIFVLLSNF